jgi:phosphate transport system protein
MSIKYDKQTQNIKEKICTLLESIKESSKLSLEAYKAKDLKIFDNAQEKIKNIQMQGDEIDNEIIKTFALYGPEASELRYLVVFLKMTNEIVRIGEGMKKYARRMREHSQCKECNLDELENTIIQLHKSTTNALEFILECFKNLETCAVDDFFRKVMVEESKNDDFFAILEKEIMSIIIREKDLASEYVRVLGTLRKLERSCDRSVNIANLMMYAKDGGEMNLYS